MALNITQNTADKQDETGFFSAVILGVAVASCMGLATWGHALFSPAIGLPIGMSVGLVLMRRDAAKT